MELDINVMGYEKMKEPTMGVTKKGYPYIGFTYPKSQEQLEKERGELIKKKRLKEALNVKNYYNCFIKLNDSKLKVVSEAQQEYTSQEFRYKLTPNHTTISTRGIQRLLKDEIKTINEIQLFIRIKQQIKKYVFLKQDSEYDVVTLYCMLTYKYQHMDFFPILHLSGEAGTGKSQIGKILAKLSFNSTSTVSATKSSFFRRIDQRRGLYFMDEKETLEEYEKELLNGCTYEGNIHTVTEKQGDNFVETEFNIYSPVVLACINEVYGATSTRMIKIETVKPPRDQSKYPVIRLTQDCDVWCDIRDDLVFWALQTYKENEQLFNVDKEMEQLISNRGVDAWKSILNLSKRIGCYHTTKAYIQDYYFEQVEELFTNDMNYKFLKFLITKENTDWISAYNLHKDFVDYELTEKQKEFFSIIRFGKTMRKIGYRKDINKKRTSQGFEYKLDYKLNKEYMLNHYEFSEYLIDKKDEEVKEENV